MANHEKHTELLMELTRRLDRDANREGGWLIYFGDVRVGHIGLVSGAPTHLPQWGWRCGFYPGREPGQDTSGTASSFEEARAGFERDWNRLRPTITDQQLNAWREHRDFTAWRDRMWDEKCRLPTQNPDGISRCFCGEEIALRTFSQHAITAHKGMGA